MIENQPLRDRMAVINSLLDIDAQHFGGLRKFPFTVLDENLCKGRVKVKAAKLAHSEVVNQLKLLNIREAILKKDLMKE